MKNLLFRIKSLALVVALLVSGYCFGQKEISVSTAQRVAETVVSNFSDNKQNIVNPEVSLLLTKTKSGIVDDNKSVASLVDNDDCYYYIFSIKQNNGYVIVSAFDAVEPVLGYSESENWEQSNLPPSLDSLMAEYESQIKFAIENQLLPDSIQQYKWNSYLNGNVPKITTGYTQGTFLIETQWGQGRPYNNLTPSINGQHAVTGCVATAMAQVLYYWAKSAYKNGLQTYEATVKIPIPNYTGVKMFNWNLMTTKYPNPNDNYIAELMYAIGVAVKMQYGVKESGANPTEISPALNYFGVKSAYIEINSIRMNRNDWDNMLREEINKNRPILYGGRGSGGHRFICDGYKNDGTFHFNFGWDGWYDTWMVTTAINPADGHNYNFSQSVIYQIDPYNTPQNVPRRPKQELPVPEKVVRETGRIIEQIIKLPGKIKIPKF